MTRKKSDTVDYFPHHCKPSKKEQIIKRRHGNNGYVVFNKLRELLGDNDGHFIDCSDEIEWNWVIEYISLEEIEIKTIINTMILVKYIDSELWKAGIIWSDEFVNSLSQVYVNRKRDLPNKPEPKEFQTSLSFLQYKSEQPNISTVEKRQSRVKESIVKKSKVNTAPKSKDFDPIDILSFFNDKDFQESWLQHRKIRKVKKGSLEPRADKSKLNKLSKFSKGSKGLSIAILDKSSESGWTDVFELEGSDKPTGYGYKCPLCDWKVSKPEMADYYCNQKNCESERENREITKTKLIFVKPLFN